MPCTIARHQAIAARRMFYGATGVIDVIFSGDLNDAALVEAVQPFIEAAGMPPVSLSDV